MKLGRLKIDDVDLASAGNAILGIRDSGKTYTATKIAEGLHAAGIPFTAFDPIGVWRFLRVPGAGPGLPVVVAGGEAADLPLTPASAPELVRAAMANGVSLVIDLFDMKLSKADWKRIVAACVRVMLHENAKHGLRHVFIEEAAEFAPQRIGPDQGQVYAEIEKLARMGGNARLGFTLVNQRAEEVNKAVLELCDNLFLHRQKGRNSLTALSRWLDIGNVSTSKAIVSALPTLPTGECFAWLQGSEEPQRIKIQAKDSLHPDRRVMRGDDTVAKKAVDVGRFVDTMRGTLGKIEKEARTLDEQRDEIGRLTREIDRLEKAKQPTGPTEQEIRQRIHTAVADVAKAFAPIASAARIVLDALEKSQENANKVLGELSASVPPMLALTHPTGRTRPALERVQRERNEEYAAVVEKVSRVTPGLTVPRQQILDTLARLEAFGLTETNRTIIASMSGVSAKSSGFANNLGALRSAGFIDYTPKGSNVFLTDAGRERANMPDRAPTIHEIHSSFLAMLSQPRREILAALIDAYPEPKGRTELAEVVGVSALSSGYANNLGWLRTLGAIDYPEKGKVVAADFLFPEA